MNYYGNKRREKRVVMATADIRDSDCLFLPPS